MAALTGTTGRRMTSKSLRCRREIGLYGSESVYNVH